MILDLLAHASLYRSLGSRFAAGLDWLADLEAPLPDGRRAIEGDDVYALVQSYETRPSVEKQFEAHQVYVDIHYIVTGCETIDYTPRAGLQPISGYDTSKDFQLYADPPIWTSLRLGPGSFAIFTPADAHRPGCINGERCQMKKVVIKLRL